MPVNDFEKRVQQRMEELKLSPSPEVWEQVASRIREKKRRRFIFWLLLPGLLLGGGILFFVFAPGKKKIVANEKVSARPNFNENDLRQEKNKNTVDFNTEKTEPENKKNNQEPGTD